jgi:phosphatidylglycerol:prolipoprotein diacylglycerol transferase
VGKRRMKMHPILFKIGSISVKSYGLMIAIGVIAAVLLSAHRSKKLGLDPEIISDLAIYAVVGGFLGAKLLFWIVELTSIIHDPSYIVETLSSGFVVYGGIMGGIGTGYIYCRKKGLDFLAHLDLIVPSIALAQGFGRIGCFEAGCCYGRETHSIIGVVFKNSSSFAPTNISLIPTQLFSSGGDFLIAAILLYYSSKAKAKGQVSGLYMILYGVGRFVIEIFRGDPRGSVGMLSTSQFICIFMILIGIYVYNLSSRKSKIQS